MPRMPSPVRRDDLLGGEFTEDEVRDQLAVQGPAPTLSRELILGADEGSFQSGALPYDPGMRETEARRRDFLAAERRAGVPIEQQRAELERQRQAAPPQGGARITFMGETKDFTQEQIRSGDIGRWRAAVAAARYVPTQRQQAQGPMTEEQMGPLVGQTPEQEARKRGAAAQRAVAQQTAQAPATAGAEGGEETALSRREAEIRKWYEDQGIIPPSGPVADEAEEAKDYMGDAATEVLGKMSPARQRVEMARLRRSASTRDKRKLAEIQSKAAQARRKDEVAAERTRLEEVEERRIREERDARRGDKTAAGEEARKTLVLGQQLQALQTDFAAADADYVAAIEAYNQVRGSGDPAAISQARKTAQDALAARNAARSAIMEFGKVGDEAVLDDDDAPTTAPTPTPAPTAAPDTETAPAPEAPAPGAAEEQTDRVLSTAERKVQQRERTRALDAPMERLSDEFDADDNGVFSAEELRAMESEYLSITRSLAAGGGSKEAREFAKQKIKDMQAVMSAAKANPFKVSGKRPVISVGGLGGYIPR